MLVGVSEVNKVVYRDTLHVHRQKVMSLINSWKRHHAIQTFEHMVQRSLQLTMTTANDRDSIGPRSRPRILIKPRTITIIAKIVYSAA